ncbi:MAG: 3'(2'),5'-bisphosphate nucleotidase CysQ [Calditrichaeota bacterium]|nr:MAG: 3'(2'),5'-bisphosphate nucleotidase CysQ [Calditrichota bacterium]
MALSSIEKKDRLDWLEHVVRTAGAIVLSHYAKKTQVEWKTDTEPVTEADRASNTFLVEKISHAFPAEGILAEESFSDLTCLKNERVWMIDPIDGTKEFIHRNGEFSIMVGLVEKGAPVLGIVYQPAEEKMYKGAKGVESIIDWQDEVIPLKVSENTKINEFNLVVSRSHLEPVMEKIRSNLGIARWRQHGSVGLKSGLIARSIYDLYFHTSGQSKLWDTCAPQALLESAGGVMTDLYGQPLNYRGKSVRNRNGILASNGCRHAEIAGIISETLLGAKKV